ncbi:MAG: bifunctional adenosylcobinamide kinase/adenosylcobinamide-phosphate guanylyltransferase [Anaerophaga sp.]|uniref:bifunctional adenosylcobinamide kinase/adenosylcobinamide-phosphate guanylyltransferase n=1 Tax=Anaerophaga thermohalophila TaxID=177400 RepID=UPI000237B92A|nr:bifunctional adenosylcobinamide kinase/adenosylcobinamide-phosphate guanylyltransferase [Anaerophaga thermohalophila]MBZ4675806.1 bifunctional adenosylcobinamide kinase/adenosylcobinamide-phosphate guanylyltransferase [Anaerophaga sp.]MDI3521001.1 adenosylcobinamide kinase / adenosylcobinamide-phosphate guanylyltransferase [Anaerophaga sp.]MDK2842350.1 adenosylcobinamide kinase / adenosylcobinamide-phosphate guanylyltransferase [Anaerophaga sp.]MDN5291653.1 adenosylcobinamide kinase / adenos
MLHFITGGQRSGKSSYAQKLALQKSANPVYLATARICDEDFRQRVERHRSDRGPEWTNIEESVNISNASVNGRVVVLDCITLWLTNIFFDNKEQMVDEILTTAKTEFDKMMEKEATFIVISNEIGLGGHADNEVARRFTDLQGWMNQYIASRADEAILMVAGLPVKLK